VKRKEKKRKGKETNTTKPPTIVEGSIEAL